MLVNYGISMESVTLLVATHADSNEVEVTVVTKKDNEEFARSLSISIVVLFYELLYCFDFQVHLANFVHIDLLMLLSEGISELF